LLLDRANIPYEFINITKNDTNININQKGWDNDKLYGGAKKLRLNKTIKNVRKNE
jgi:hypothetical protein